MSENINLQNEAENVIIATFELGSGRIITLQNLEGVTSIDWGDGTVNNELSHEYSQSGKYICKIYNCNIIGENAFDILELTSIIIPNSVTSIDGHAFHYTSLKSVTIGRGLISIGTDAFFSCTQLTDIYITDIEVWCNISGLHYLMHNGGFGYTKNKNLYLNGELLTNLVIPETVLSIPNLAFYKCVNLTNVIIPDNVTTIGSNVFGECTNLTNITIGNSIISIGINAFLDCNSLANVTLKNTTPFSTEILNNSGLNNSQPTYYVPKDSIEAYRNAWADKVEPDKIQVDPDENLINLEGLKIYHNTLKEKYLNLMATKNWVNEQLVGKTDYLGVVDTVPNFPNAEAGDYCRVQTEFIYDEATGEKAHVGDVLIAVKDNPTQGIADWDLLHNELASATLVTVSGVAQTSWDADTKVGFDHITSSTRAGLMMVGEGLIASSSGNGKVNIRKAEKSDIDAKTHNYKPITPILSEYTTMKCLTDVKDTTLWTDDTTDESGAVVQGTKTKACETIGAVKQITYDKNLTSPQGSDGTYNGIVYARSYTNEEAVFPVTNQNRNYTIPIREHNGNFYVNTPKNAWHCANKKYVDDLVGDINTVLEAIMGV